MPPHRAEGRKGEGTRPANLEKYPWTSTEFHGGREDDGEEEGERVDEGGDEWENDDGDGAGRGEVTSTTGKTHDHEDEQQHHGDRDVQAGRDLDKSIFTAWPWRALTKAPEVPAGDETKGRMIVLAAKATSYKELDPGT